MFSVTGRALRHIEFADGTGSFRFKAFHVVMIIAGEIPEVPRSKFEYACCKSFDKSAVLAYEHHSAAEIAGRCQKDIFRMHIALVCGVSEYKKIHRTQQK